jgi:serine/threonine protein kinase
VKVADFGIAGIADRANPNIDCGTLKYMAPEVLSGAEKENSPAADVWALGCIFYYLLEGRPPFVGKTGQ